MQQQCNNIYNTPNVFGIWAMNAVIKDYLAKVSAALALSPPMPRQPQFPPLLLLWDQAPALLFWKSAPCCLLSNLPHPG